MLHLHLKDFLTYATLTSEIYEHIRNRKIPLETNK